MITIGYNQVQEKHVADINSTRREDAHEAKKVYVGNKLAYVHVNDNTEFALRQTLNGYIHEDNDLYAKISSIKGNTKVWNQLLKNNSASESVSGITITNNSDGTFTCSGTVTSLVNKSLTVSVDFPFLVAGHYYLLRGCPEGGSLVNSYCLRNNAGTISDEGNGKIFNVSSTGALQFNIGFRVGTYSTIVFKPVIIDLTLIYGAGNEPTTVAEFEADFQQWFGRPIGAEPYDAGSLIPFVGTGIKSTWTKDGVQHETTVPIPVTTLTGKAEGSTTSEVIFPDGMKSAGSVKDEVYVEDGKTYAVKRVGSVDLGDLSWSMEPSHTGGFYSSPPSNSKIGLSGLVNTKYEIYPNAFSWNDFNSIPNKILAKSRTSAILYCKDTSYTDATTFKAAMSGVMLYYELATPIVYEVDNYTLPLYYPANGTGTEEIQSTATTAPADMDIEYRLRQRVRLVDMGTPGVLWADSDIDITKPDGFCDSPFTYDKSFFSWGNVVGHNPISNTAFDYDWGDVNQAEPWYEGQVYGSTPGSTLTGNIPADAQYDAAKAVLGGNWRMPSNGEYGALLSVCKFLEADGSDMDTSKTDKRVDMSDGNGGTVKGIYIESTVTGNRLFFSCSGYGVGRSWYGRGSSGLFWSSPWSSARYARHLFFNSGGVYPQYGSNRYYGFALRPVYPISQ